MRAIDLKEDPRSTRWVTPRGDEEQINHFHFRVSSRSGNWRPPTDVYETESNVIIRVEVAGMREAEFSVSLDEKILSIKGVRSDENERRAYHQMEIRFGEFSTNVELHWAIDHEEIEAEYDDGFLKIMLPKSEPRQIEIGE